MLQPIATDDFGQHSLLSTINVLRAVIAVAAQVGPKYLWFSTSAMHTCLNIFFFLHTHLSPPRLLLLRQCHTLALRVLTYIIAYPRQNS